MSKLRLLVVDDHEVVRAGLRTLLSMEDDLEVVGRGRRTARPRSARRSPCAPTWCCSTS